MSNSTGPSVAEAPIDMAQLLMNVGEDQSLLEELFRVFRLDATISMAAVRNAVKSGDAGAVRTTAHRIRGMLLTVAADEAASLARALEESGRSGDLSAASEKLARLSAAVDRAVEATLAPLALIRPAA